MTKIRLLYVCGLVCSLAFSVACAPPEQRLNGDGTQYLQEFGDFSSYVSLLIQRGSEVGKPVVVQNLRITYGDLGNSQVLGRCSLKEGIPTIIVDKEAWADAGNVEREILMMHELGHCVLGIGHVDETIEGSNRPASLMNPYIINEVDYEQNYWDYMTELFSHV